jgi:hypothetical protein
MLLCVHSPLCVPRHGNMAANLPGQNERLQKMGKKQTRKGDLQGNGLTADTTTYSLQMCTSTVNVYKNEEIFLCGISFSPKKGCARVLAIKVADVRELNQPYGCKHITPYTLARSKLDAGTQGRYILSPPPGNISFCVLNWP